MQEGEKEGMKLGSWEVRKLGSWEVRKEDRKRQAVVGPAGLTFKIEAYFRHYF